MSGLDIDTRSDIYSLGRPALRIAGRQQRRSTPSGTGWPPRPGRHAQDHPGAGAGPPEHFPLLATLHGAGFDHSRSQTQVAIRTQRKLLHQIKGDLDWIVMKCLEKDRSRRYETANGLAMDIQRHLQNELVVARPPSLGYKFQKLVRRNKLAFAAVGAVIAALIIIGLAVSTWMFFKEQQARKQAEAERQIAKTEAAKATAISDFLQQSLQSANPDDIKGSDYTVRQQLDDFSEGLKNQFQDQPEVEAQVRETIGKAYYRLGVGDKAQGTIGARAGSESSIVRRQRTESPPPLRIAHGLPFEQGQFTNASNRRLVRRWIFTLSERWHCRRAGAFCLLGFAGNSARTRKIHRCGEIIGEQALKLALQTPNNAVSRKPPASSSHMMSSRMLEWAVQNIPEAESCYARRAVEMHRRLQEIAASRNRMGLAGAWDSIGRAKQA